MVKSVYHKPTLLKIPERERWLFRNPEALASVMQGLKEAREGKLTDGPVLLSERDCERLENPPEPTEALRRAARRYREQIPDDGLTSIYGPVTKLLTGEK